MGILLKQRLSIGILILLFITTGVNAAAPTTNPTTDSDAALIAEMQKDPRWISFNAGQLDQTIAGLDNPDTKLTCYGKLMRFSQLYNWQMGSIAILNIHAYLERHPDVQERVDRANTALAKVYIDDRMVKDGLVSNDPFLEEWAMRGLGKRLGGYSGLGSNDPQFGDMMARVRSLAQCDNEQLRYVAEDTLWSLPDQQAFVRSLIGTELCPENVLRMVVIAYPRSFSDPMNVQLIRLLGNDDAKVRSRAMRFISSNEIMAPIYPVQFNAAVLNRLVELSKSQADRADAGEAIACIYSVDPVHSLAVLKSLTADPDRNVRLYVLYGLVNKPLDAGRHDIAESLVGDSDDEVSCFAVLAAGSAEHVARLQALTHSSNSEVAGIAAWQLIKLQKPATRN